MPSVFLIATLDTKGREADFLRVLLTSWGVAVTLVDVGALGTPAATADVPIPFSPVLEGAVEPTLARIVAAVREVVDVPSRAATRP